MPEVEPGLVIVVIFVLGTILEKIVSYFLKERKRGEKHRIRREVLKELSDLFERAATEVQDLDREIEERKQRVAELDAVKEHYTALIKINKKQVNAIKKELAKTVKERERWEFLGEIIVNGFFFVLGMAVTYFLR